jgi:hypothetical protein
MLSSNKIYMLRDCEAAPEPPSPPFHTVNVYKVYLFTKGREREKSLTREKVREAAVHKAGLKIPTRLTVSPVYKL